MEAQQTFDTTAGHRHVSAHYFNRVGGPLEQAVRTREEDALMISMCHASLAHRRGREDLEPRYLSVGYWQLSRVYAAVGKGTPARRYARLCLEASSGEAPFYIGYAHEALCRAAMLKGEAAEAIQHLAGARDQLDLVGGDVERVALEVNLETHSLALAADE